MLIYFAILLFNLEEGAKRRGWNLSPNAHALSNLHLYIYGFVTRVSLCSQSLLLNSPVSTNCSLSFNLNGLESDSQLAADAHIGVGCGLTFAFTRSVPPSSTGTSGMSECRTSVISGRQLGSGCTHSTATAATCVPNRKYQHSDGIKFFN